MSLRDRRLYVINDSGGKDSRAMFLYITQDMRIPPSQIIVVHAILPGMDWEGTEEYIIKNCEGYRVIFTQAKKTFFDMVRSRKMNRPDVPSFPSSSSRQCTSDLKRDPIEKVVRKICRDEGWKTVFNCMGIRAEESTSRAKKKPFKVNKRLTIPGRFVVDCLPIHARKESWVRNKVAEHGQELFYTYAAGMKRKSCKICLLACSSDVKTSAEIDPEHAEKMMSFEDEIGYTMFQGKSIKQILES